MNYFKNEFNAFIDSNQHENESLLDLRKKSFKSFINSGLPTKKWENWQFTNFSNIENQNFRLPYSKNITKIPDILPGRIPNTYLALMINGFYQVELSDLPDDVKISFDDDHLNLSSEYYSSENMQNDWKNCLNPFYMLNTSMMNSGMTIHLKKNTILSKPIQIIYLTASNTDKIMNHPRFIFNVGDNSEMTLIEHYISSNSTSYFNNTVTNVGLGENSFLNHIRIQEEASNSHHVANTFYKLDQKSTLITNSASFGSSLYRHNINLKFCGNNSNANYSALSLIEKKQHHDQNITIEHMTDSCQSDQLFKYILSDESSGVFNGKVVVEEHTKQTNANQSNKNLVLSPTALMNANPQLEIYAEDVKCSHGSTTGQIDPEALFYLKSRGLSHQKSMELIMSGFISDIIEFIKNEDIAKYLNEVASQQLEKILV
jgi:Fe-S cluster assembly protein SufD|tara:strand:+ start:3136 stop:4425 length:1290 start_codon:yes stop_codon:yes gene_type:complete